MPEKPVVGGRRWVQDGIDPAIAYWVEINAYRAAMLEYLSNKDLPGPERIRIDLLPMINGMTNALLGQRHALHELEIIGLEAKKERLNGEDLRA